VYGNLKSELEGKLDAIEAEGLYKEERVLAGPQGAVVRLAGPGGGAAGRELLNFCANNYLGLAQDPSVRAAAAAAMEEWGYGMASVRFICGAQEPHARLERAMADFLGMDDAILFSSCFDANGGVFEALLDEDCAVIADSLNHASIIDGVRLCKARRWVYKHADMRDVEETDPETGKAAKGLERCLKEAAGCRLRMIATDGVFSMDGDIADLDAICGLAERYGALVMVDDSHATGFVGPGGRGTWELKGVAGRVDIITTTFGKALGGASGGCVAGRAEIVAYLRQKSRPYLFSNSLAPPIVGGTLRALEIIRSSAEPRERLAANTARFREGMAALGFDLRPGSHPICPVMLYEERLAKAMASELLGEGVYVVGFSFPVVPRGKARIRVQLSAAHSSKQVDRALDAFARVGKRLGVV
jgi:glycine C-acetyltransferase